MITMLRTLLLSAAALHAAHRGPADALWTGPVFDAHLHYNEDAAAVLLHHAAFESWGFTAAGWANCPAKWRSGLRGTTARSCSVSNNSHPLWRETTLTARDAL